MLTCNKYFGCYQAYRSSTYYSLPYPYLEVIMKDASYDYEQAQKLASFKTRLSVANALMAYTWALIAGMELYLHTFSNQGFVIYAVVLCAVVGNGLTIKAAPLHGLSKPSYGASGCHPDSKPAGGAEESRSITPPFTPRNSHFEKTLREGGAFNIFK